MEIEGKRALIFLSFEKKRAARFFPQRVKKRTPQTRDLLVGKGEKKEADSGLSNGPERRF